MKLTFKDIVDSFPDFGIRVSTDKIVDENVIENKIKIVHHDHAFKKIIYYHLSVGNVISK